MVSRVLEVQASRNDGKVLASAGLGARWPGSVVAGRVRTDFVASYCVGSGARSLEWWERIAYLRN